MGEAGSGVRQAGSPWVGETAGVDCRRGPGLPKNGDHMKCWDGLGAGPEGVVKLSSLNSASTSVLRSTSGVTVSAAAGSVAAAAGVYDSSSSSWCRWRCVGESTEDFVFTTVIAGLQYPVIKIVETFFGGDGPLSLWLGNFHLPHPIQPVLCRRVVATPTRPCSTPTRRYEVWVLSSISLVHWGKRSYRIPGPLPNNTPPVVTTPSATPMLGPLSSATPSLTPLSTTTPTCWIKLVWLRHGDELKEGESLN